jgi:ABC-type cobalamin/Fe3+-siderophores transport system ATPase subunit
MIWHEPTLHTEHRHRIQVLNVNRQLPGAGIEAVALSCSIILVFSFADKVLGSATNEVPGGKE